MSFKSCIPPEISEYKIDDSEFAAQTDELNTLFSNLRDFLEAADKDSNVLL